MECNFYVNEDHPYSPRNPRVEGTLTLSAKSDVGEIYAITYGLKTKTQLLTEYDEHGSITNPVLYEYYSHHAKNAKELKEFLETYDSARETKEIYITSNDLIAESGDKFVSTGKGPDTHWALPKGETVVVNFDLCFPSPIEWYLPSTADRMVDLKAPYNWSIQVQYWVYVRVQRQGTFLKRVKDKEYRQQILYQAGTQFPFPTTIHKYINKKEFKNKVPRPDLIDPTTGSYEGGDIASGQSSLFKKLFQKKQGYVIPLTTVLKVNSTISLYEPLFTQLGLTFQFDFSNLDYPGAFAASKRSTGLGLFQIESLKLYVLYSTCLTIDDESYRSDTPPQKFLEFKFHQLAFDMRDAHYNPETKIGSLKVPPKVFAGQKLGDTPLIEALNTPLLCSCDVYDTIRNFTALQFVWTIADSETRLKCTFNTDATISAELETVAAPVYEELSTPAYEERESS